MPQLITWGQFPGCSTERRNPTEAQHSHWNEGDKDWNSGRPRPVDYTGQSTREESVGEKGRE